MAGAINEGQPREAVSIQIQVSRWDSPEGTDVTALHHQKLTVIRDSSDNWKVSHSIFMQNLSKHELDEQTVRWTEN